MRLDIQIVLASTTDQTNEHSLSFSDDYEQKLLREKGFQFACTDLGNCERFVTKHGQRLRYIQELGRWAEYDGTRWKLEPKLLRHAAITVKSILKEAEACEKV